MQNYTDFPDSGFFMPFIIVAFLVLAFYLTLTFIHHLKSKDARAAPQSKLAAVICPAIALAVVLQLVFLPIIHELTKNRIHTFGHHTL